MNWNKRGSDGKYKAGWRFKGIMFVMFSVGLLTAGHLYVEPAIDAANAEARKLLDSVQAELHYVAAPRVEAAEVEVVPSETALAAMKNDLLKTLQMCESGGKEGEAAYELVTFDPDKTGKVSQVPSFGQFQFKVDTMKGYWKKMTGEVLTTRQAQDHGQDGEQSWKTADYVIFGIDVPPSNDWYHCSVKYDLDKTAAYINKYDK